MAVDFDSILGSLQKDQGRLRRETGVELGGALLNQNRQQQDLITQLATAYQDPSFSGAINNAVDAKFTSISDALRRDYGQQAGKMRSASASRGTLGGSGSARRQGSASAAYRGGLEQAGLAAEGAKRTGMDARDRQALELIQQILNPQATNQAAAGAMGQGLSQQAATSEALGDLDFAGQQIISNMLGDIFRAGGDFGAAGFDYARRNNQFNPDAQANWFTYGGP